MSEIKIIGLDLDGTLYPSTNEIQTKIRTHIYQLMSEYFLISFDDAKKYFEDEYAKTFSGGKAIKETALKLNKTAPTEDFVQKAIEESDILELIQPNPKLNKILGDLAKNREIYLLTGSNEEMALKKLDKIGINKRVFKKIFTKEDGSKVEGDLYEKWLQERRVEPGKHLYIGDNKKQDIIVPKSFGIRTCFLGEHIGEADFSIHKIEEIANLFSEKI